MWPVNAKYYIALVYSSCSITNEKFVIELFCQRPSWCIFVLKTCEYFLIERVMNSKQEILYSKMCYTFWSWPSNRCKKESLSLWQSAQDLDLFQSSISEIANSNFEAIANTKILIITLSWRLFVFGSYIILKCINKELWELVSMIYEYEIRIMNYHKENMIYVTFLTNQSIQRKKRFCS